MASSSSAEPVVPAVAGDAPGVNLGRSLLVNVSGVDQQPPSFFGQEYVSPSFSAAPMTSGLQTARRALFGGTPDLAGLNYMAWQYMRILHSTEYESYITDLDSRITYLHNKSLVDYDYGETVDENSNALQFLGTPQLGDASGRLEERWLIERPSPSTYRIKNYRTGVAQNYLPVVTEGITDYMVMTGHPDYKVRVLTGSATKSVWNVSYLAKPQATLDPVNRAAQLANIGTEAYLELFPRRDPYNLFRELWEKHQEFAYQMSGPLLALIYRTQELRLGA